MKVRFTAEIIDDNGNVVGTRTCEQDGVPSPDDFDLSTREGFLKDFDTLEKTVLKARNQIGEDVASEILAAASKKNGRNPSGKGKPRWSPNSAGSPCGSVTDLRTPSSQKKGL